MNSQSSRGFEIRTLPFFSWHTATFGFLSQGLGDPEFIREAIPGSTNEGTEESETAEEKRQVSVCVVRSLPPSLNIAEKLWRMHLKIDLLKDKEAGLFI